MNNEIIFQNTDSHQPNPFSPSQATPSKSAKLVLPKDKRILALMILGIVIALLSLISLLVSSTRKRTPPVRQITPAPTISSESPTPTIAADQFPGEFQPQIDTIELHLHPIPELNPPTIDDTVGL